MPALKEQLINKETDWIPFYKGLKLLRSAYFVLDNKYAPGNTKYISNIAK
jgi:hypothetical protein